MFFHSIQNVTSDNRNVNMVLHKIANRETFFKTNYVFSVGNHNIWCVKIKKNQGLSRA